MRKQADLLNVVLNRMNVQILAGMLAFSLTPHPKFVFWPWAVRTSFLCYIYSEELYHPKIIIEVHFLFFFNDEVFADDQWLGKTPKP